MKVLQGVCTIRPDCTGREIQVRERLHRTIRPTPHRVSTFLPGLNWCVGVVRPLLKKRSFRRCSMAPMLRSHRLPFLSLSLSPIRSPRQFASYGDYWIPFIDGAQITLEVNLAQAEEFLRDEYWPWIQARHGRLSDEFKEELWQLTSKNFPVYSKSFTVLPQVPWKQVEAFLEAHPAAQDHSAVKHFVRKQSVRTMDWLNTYGYCQDHLIPAKSTIPQAGRGAFANRDLPKGTVVGYSPLIHIGVHGRDLYWISYPADKDHAAAAAATTDSTPETPTMPTKKKRHMYDLILNYSFGHANSTLLLTPYGGMVNYINHPPKGVTPNVAIRWPNKELVAHKPWWHDRTPEQLRDTVEKIGLSFEYVALRDIAAGEEVRAKRRSPMNGRDTDDDGRLTPTSFVRSFARSFVRSRDCFLPRVPQVFMDYGPEWEAAWEAHVKSWYPPPESLHYMSRSEWPEKYIRTIDEAEYPDNLVTLCIESYTTSDDDTSYWLPVLVETPHRVYCRALERFESERTSDDEDDNDNNIAKKGTATYTYTVELDVTVGSESTKIVVHDVPEEGIFLLDRAYSQDWHLPQAFRHEIMLPDHLMPPAWHNGPAVPPQSDDDSRTQHPLDSNDEDDDDMDSDDE